MHFQAMVGDLDSLNEKKKFKLSVTNENRTY